MRKLGYCLLFVLLASLIAWRAFPPSPPSNHAASPATALSAPGSPAANSAKPDNAAGFSQTADAQAASGWPDFLPPEAHAVVAAIRQGGPFPYAKDGTVFSNYENRLPQQPRGWYHEYTVATPGIRNRGTRRIITGGTPPQAWYYTGDHYETFRAFTPPPTP
jgi:guanyl-specific ribonuclease Sa